MNIMTVDPLDERKNRQIKYEERNAGKKRLRGLVLRAQGYIRLILHRVSKIKHFRISDESLMRHLFPHVHDPRRLSRPCSSGSIGPPASFFLSFVYSNAHSPPAITRSISSHVRGTFVIDSQPSAVMTTLSSIRTPPTLR